MAVKTVQIDSASPTRLHVAKFASNGFLTAANFEAAFNGCIAYSLALPRSASILIPAGDWLLTGGIRIKGRGYATMPMIIGAGRDSTILRWPDTFNGTCVFFDGWGGFVEDVMPNSLYFGGGLQDLSIRSENGFYSGRAVGFRFNNWIAGMLRNVNVGGFGNYANDGWRHGVAVLSEGNDSQMVRGVLEVNANSQNCLFDNVIISQSTTGMRVNACTQFTLNQVQFNQNRGFCDMTLEHGSEVLMNGGMFQSGNDATGYSWNVYKGHDFYSIRSMGGLGLGGINSGATASLSAVSAGLVTVTGLTGMTAASVDNYLYFTNTASEANGGIFQIVAYVNGTSVKVAKKNGGIDTKNGALTWEEHKYAGGNFLTLNGPIYHEGDIPAFIKTQKTYVGQDKIILRGVDTYNQNHFADLDGTYEVAIEYPMRAPNAFWLKARGVDRLTLTGEAFGSTVDSSWFDVDSYTRERVTINGRTLPYGKTLTEILDPASAEIFDPSRQSAVALVSGYVDTLTGINGTVLRAPTAATRAVWIASHPRLGGRPAVGARMSGSRRLSGTLAVPIPVGAYYGLFMIASLPSGYTASSGQARGVMLENADSSDWMRISIDAGDSGGAVNGYMAVVGGSGCPTQKVSGRKTFVVLAAPQHSADPTYFVPTLWCNGTVSGYGGVTPKAATKVVDKIYFTGNPGAGGQAADIDIAYVAVLKRPLTIAESKAVWNAAADYLRDTAPSVSPTLSGTITPDSLADSVVCVDVSTIDATVNLPAGHRAGDRLTIKLVSAAIKLCSIVPAAGTTIDGSSLVTLASDYEWITLVSNGVGWFQVS